MILSRQASTVMTVDMHAGDAEVLVYPSNETEVGEKFIRTINREDSDDCVEVCQSPTISHALIDGDVKIQTT